MKKEKFLAILGASMLLISLGIFGFSYATKTKAATDFNKWHETWTINQYRNFVKGANTISTGPAKWTVTGCLGSADGSTCPSGTYTITYSAGSWQENVTDPALHGSFATGNWSSTTYFLSNWTYFQDTLYRIAERGTQWDQWYYSWPKSWDISGQFSS